MDIQKMILIWCGSPSLFLDPKPHCPLHLRWWQCCRSFRSDRRASSINGGSSQSDWRREREAVKRRRERGGRGGRFSVLQEAQIGEVSVVSLGVHRRPRHLPYLLQWPILHLLDHARCRLWETQAASHRFGSPYAQVRSLFDSFLAFFFFSWRF